MCWYFTRKSFFICIYLPPENQIPYFIVWRVTARKPPRNHGAYKVQASLTSSTLLTEMEQQWHEPQKLNNENNLWHKNSKKESNEGKAKSEKKPFFWSTAGWSNRAIRIFTVMSPSPKLLLWCFVASSTLWRAASTLSDGKPSLQTMHRYVGAHIMYFWLSLVGSDGKIFGPQSWWKFCTA